MQIKHKLKPILIILLTLILIASMSITALAAVPPVNGGDDAASGDSELEITKDPNFSTRRDTDEGGHNSGLRLTLWDKAAKKTLKVVDVLQKPPLPRARGFRKSNRIDYGGTQVLFAEDKQPYANFGLFPNVPPVGNDMGMTAEDREAWLRSEEAIDIYEKTLGVTLEELETDKYYVLVEPLVELHMNSSTATMVVTSYEAAAYVISYENLNAELYGKFKSQLANMTQSALPAHYFFKEDHPDLRLSKGSPGHFGVNGDGKKTTYYDLTEVLYTGLGIGLLQAIDFGEVKPEVPAAPLTGNLILKDEVNRPFNQQSRASAPRWDGYKDWNTTSNTSNDNYLYQPSPSSGKGGSATIINKFIGDRKYVSPDTQLRLNEYMYLTREFKTTGVEKGFTNVAPPKDTITPITSRFPSVYFTGYVMVEPECYCSAYDPDTGTGGCEGHDPVAEHRDATVAQNPSSFTYSAEATYFEEPKSLEIPLPSMGYNASMHRVVFPVDGVKTETFYPTYKMKLYEGNDAMTAPESVWMISSGLRTLKSTPHIVIDRVESKTDLKGTWSRDKIDTLDTKLKTTKSGTIMTPKVEHKYKVKLEYYVQDPFFKTGVSQPLQIPSQYLVAFDETVKQLKSNVYIFSNASFTGSEEMNTIGVSVNKINKEEILRKSYHKGSLASQSQVGSTTRNITVANSDITYGKNVTGTTTTVNGIKPSQNHMDISPLVVSGTGDNSWYVEDYEGILKVIVEQEISVRGPDNYWVEVYREISDGLDIEPIKSTGGIVANNVGKPVNIYKGNNFVIGYGSRLYKNGLVPDLMLYGKYNEFKIRGNANNMQY